MDQSTLSYRSAMERYSNKSAVSRKRQQSLEGYIQSYVGAQFYELVFQLSNEQHAECEIELKGKGKDTQLERKALLNREKRFKQNERLLLDRDGFQLDFCSQLESYPTHVREVLQFLQQTITGEDLVELQQGDARSPNLINFYYKILEKINFVLQRTSDYLK